MRKFLIKAGLYICLIFFILNPYTIYGRPGIVISILLVLYAIRSGVYKTNLKANSLIFSLMICISLFGALVSYLNGIGQFNHPFAVVSLAIVWLSAQSIYKLCVQNGISFDEFALMILHVILLNYSLILMEVNFPALRDAVENFLVPTGNIDWTDGFRYRGISASGGAGLSLLLPITASITLYLYSQMKLGIFFTFISILISLLATLVIGRTGLVLLLIVFTSYLILIITRSFNRPRIILGSSVFVILGVLIFFVGYDYLLSYLDEMFGKGFVSYSFGFLFKGREGIESEGTVGTIAKFLSILPTNFPEIITGYGFYGGSDFSPWTDSGYSRMFLSVGWPFGLLFYVCVFYLFFKNFRINMFLILTMGAILLAAEAKEPLLFSGNASRVFILIVVFLSMQREAKLSAKNAFIFSTKEKNYEFDATSGIDLMHQRKAIIDI